MLPQLVSVFLHPDASARPKKNAYKRCTCVKLQMKFEQKTNKQLLNGCVIK